MSELVERALAVRLSLFTVVLLAAGVMTVIACSGESETPAPRSIVLTDPVADPTATPQAIVTSFEGKVQEFEVSLAFNGSPQQGTAVFTRKNDFAAVAIKLRPGVAAQTATLRRGTCPAPTGYKLSLNPVIGGVMRQELRNVPFEDLLKGDLTLVINTEVDRFNLIAACGDLPKVP